MVQTEPEEMNQIQNFKKLQWTVYQNPRAAEEDAQRTRTRKRVQAERIREEVQVEDTPGGFLMGWDKGQRSL